MFLCTWSVIHPNLPALTDSPYRLFVRRLVYLLAALCAPEFLACTALMELEKVRVLQGKVRACLLALLAMR
jgi:hypothetical protein